MAVQQGNTINASDIAARYTSYDLVATAGQTKALTLPSNAGYVFFTYDTANHSVYGSGIAYYIDSSSGWCIKQPTKVGTTVIVEQTTSKTLQLRNTSSQIATMFYMWVAANDV